MQIRAVPSSYGSHLSWHPGTNSAFGPGFHGHGPPQDPSRQPALTVRLHCPCPGRWVGAPQHSSASLEPGAYQLLLSRGGATRPLSSMKQTDPPPRAPCSLASCNLHSCHFASGASPEYPALCPPTHPFFVPALVSCVAFTSNWPTLYSTGFGLLSPAPRLSAL